MSNSRIVAIKNLANEAISLSLGIKLEIGETKQIAEWTDLHLEDLKRLRYDDVNQFVNQGKIQVITEGSYDYMVETEYDVPLRPEWGKNGFVDRTTSAISFNDTTRIFTIQPVGTAGSSFIYYVGGIKYTVPDSDPKTVELDDTEGAWFIYFQNGILEAVNKPTKLQLEQILGTVAPVAWVYWDSSEGKGIVFEERHSMNMSPTTHSYLHFGVGPAYITGLAPTDIYVDEDGSSDYHAQFGVEAGSYLDEDISNALSAVSSGVGLQIWHRDGSLYNWKWTTESGFSFLNAPAGRPYYDNGGVLTEAPDNTYFLIHVFATAVQHGKPIAMIGQVSYANKTDAQNGAGLEISNIVGVWGQWEDLRPIATVIFHTNDTYANGVKAIIVSTNEGGNCIDWRGESLTGTSAGDHGVLGGLADDDHTQYLRTDGTRELTGNWNTGGVYGIEAPWLQLDLDFVDSSVEGRLQWNAEDGTMEYGLPGGIVTLQVGQEHVIKVYNDSGVDIKNGKCVYISGAVGNRVTVAQAIATPATPSHHHVAGLATEDIDDGQFGYITTTGLVRDINTKDMPGGSRLFLSPTVLGGYQLAHANPPNMRVMIGWVVREHQEEGVILVHVIEFHKSFTMSDHELVPASIDGQWYRWVDANSQFELQNDSSIEHIGDGLKIGSVTDYVQVDSDGKISLVAGARVKKYLSIDAIRLGTGAQKPTEVNIGNYVGYSYGIGDDSKFEFEVPHDWAVGTDIDLKAHFYIDEDQATNNGYMNWKIDYSCTPADNTELIDAPTHSGTLSPGSTPIPTNAKYLNETPAGRYVIPASDLAAHDIVGVTFERVVNSGGENNPTAEPVIVGIELEYISDRMGSY